MCCCDAGKRRLLQITYHLVTIITQHPTPITHHPTPITQIGEMSGEVSGEVFRQHPTIQNARLQRILAHFGEVLAIFLNKQHQNLNKESASEVCHYMCTALAHRMQRFLTSQQRIGSDVGGDASLRRISASVTTVADVTHRFPFDARKTACSFQITKRRRRFFTPLRPCCS